MVSWSKNISEAIADFLNHNGWNFTFEDEYGVFTFNINIKGKLRNIRYIIKVLDDSYIVYAISPMSVDAEDRDALVSMAEFICRANYGLRNGNFEMDMRDGEIRYRCYVPCGGDNAPERDTVVESVVCPAMMFKRYGNGLLDIIFGMANAEDAVKKCEDSDERLRALLSLREDAQEKAEEGEGGGDDINTDLFKTEGDDE